MGERGLWWYTYRKFGFDKIRKMMLVVGSAGLSTSTLGMMMTASQDSERIDVSSSSDKEQCGVESESTPRRQRIPTLSNDWKCISHTDRLNIQRKFFRRIVDELSEGRVGVRVCVSVCVIHIYTYRSICISHKMAMMIDARIVYEMFSSMSH
jgi:hypothetical protein